MYRDDPKKQWSDARYRNINSRERTRLSSWHYGSYLSGLPEKKYNRLKVVNALGIAYAKNPSQEAALALIEAFHAYFMKYVGLLMTGKIQEGKLSWDTRRFLQLFMGRASPTTFGSCAARLPNAFAWMNADDCYNELVMLFLSLAKRFDPKIGGFTGYIQHHFKYVVKGRMFKIQRDPLNYIGLHDGSANTPDEIQFVEGDEGALTSLSGYHATGFHTSPRSYEDIDLPSFDLSFIMTPPKPFDEIWSREQRRVLVMRHFVDMSDSAIAVQCDLGSAANVRAIHDEAIEIYLDFSERSTISDDTPEDSSDG